jgi:hypothetical protein
MAEGKAVDDQVQRMLDAQRAGAERMEERDRTRGWKEGGSIELCWNTRGRHMSDEEALAALKAFEPPINFLAPATASLKHRPPSPKGMLLDGLVCPDEQLTVETLAINGEVRTLRLWEPGTQRWHNAAIAEWDTVCAHNSGSDLQMTCMSLGTDVRKLQQDLESRIKSRKDEQAEILHH